MSWTQIKLQTTSDRCDFVESLLLECGACAVTIQDALDHPIYEPAHGTEPLWEQIILTGLFDASLSIDEIVIGLNTQGEDTFTVNHIDIIDDKQWDKEWTKHFHPIQFREKLWICPSWIEPPDPKGLNLKIDPGLAFGTGSHPTTALCIEWLANHDIEGLQLIDYGCGSGILGLAGTLLGAKHCVSIDTDQQALDSTIINTQKNNIPDSQLQTYLPENAPQIKADIVISNILANTLIDLCEHLSSYQNSNGIILLSGILKSQVEEVSIAYHEWYSIKSVTTRDEWACIHGIKKAS